MSYLKCDYDQSKIALAHQQHKAIACGNRSRNNIEYSLFSVTLIKICDAVVTAAVLKLCDECAMRISVCGGDSGDDNNKQQKRWAEIPLHKSVFINGFKAVYITHSKDEYYLLSQNQNSPAHCHYIAFCTLCGCLRSFSHVFCVISLAANILLFAPFQTAVHTHTHTANQVDTVYGRARIRALTHCKLQIHSERKMKRCFFPLHQK